MVVVSRPRMPSVPRKGCPAPAEVLFLRGVTRASVAATGDEASSKSSSARCGGVAVEDQRIPVQRALSVLRGVGLCVDSVASQWVVSASRKVASASRRVASESELVASASQCAASQSSAYRYRVASASPSTASTSARNELPSSTLPLVLKSLARRAAAAKVSRRWRRLEDASSSPVALRPVVSSAELVASGAAKLGVNRSVASVRRVASVPVVSASVLLREGAYRARAVH